jgi:hypothetical protein
LGWQQSAEPYGKLKTNSILRKMIKNPSETILSTCMLIKYWTSLYRGGSKS